MTMRAIGLGLAMWAAAVPAWGQGMISGGAKAAPRAKLSGLPWPVSFVDVGAESGLNEALTYGDERKKKYVVEANGSGAAFVDYDGDGLLDVFLVNGSKLEGFAAGAAPTNKLYRNAGGGRFADVTRAAGMDRAGWGNGVCAGDVDNDGWTDLYVTYWGENVLYRNAGNGSFRDITRQSGTGGDGKQWSTGCTFVDYDRDGYVDLLVARYLNFEMANAPLAGSQPYCMWKGSPVYCGPRGLKYGSLALYRNRGDLTFEDVTAKAGIGEPRNYYAFTAVAADLDGDGWTDVYVACDSTPSIFFRNQRDGTFRDIATETGLAYNDNGSEQAGMGLSVGDFDNDGRLDVMKTNFTGDYPNLYRNLGRGLFADVSMKAGLAVNPDYVLWGTGFVDLDNDGRQDVLQVSGHVYPEVGAIDARDAYKRNRLVYRNLGGGKYEDMTAQSGAGINAEHSSRGAAYGDFDNDGDIDVLVMNMHERPSLLRNELKSANRWVKLKPRGVKSNRAAIGATVVVEAGGVKQAQAVLSQSSFLSVNDSRLHFGLGGAGKAERVTVRWPSGVEEVFGEVEAGRLYVLEEGSGQARQEALPR